MIWGNGIVRRLVQVQCGWGSYNLSLLFFFLSLQLSGVSQFTLRQLWLLSNSRLELLKTINIISQNLWLKVSCIQGRGSHSPTPSHGCVPFHCQALPWSPKLAVNTLWSIQSRGQKQVADPGKGERSNAVLLFAFPFSWPAFPVVCGLQSPCGLRAGCSLGPWIKMAPGWAPLDVCEHFWGTLEMPGGRAGVDGRW